MEMARSGEEIDRLDSSFNGETRVISSCILHGRGHCGVALPLVGTAQACLQGAGDGEASAQR